MQLSTILSIFLAFSFLCLCQSCTHTASDASTASAPIAQSSAGAAGTPIVDAAGNNYPTTKIGEQTWMAVNLRNTVSDCIDSLELIFTNGIERGPGVVFYDGQARYAYYNNQASDKFGALYNYSAITKCQLCPPGYRIPTKADWETLIQTLGDTAAAGRKLLMSNEGGFAGELAGRIDSYGSVLGGSRAYWWTLDLDATQNRAYAFSLFGNATVKLSVEDLRIGNSVRCIKVENL